MFQRKNISLSGCISSESIEAKKAFLFSHLFPFLSCSTSLQFFLFERKEGVRLQRVGNDLSILVSSCSNSLSESMERICNGLFLARRPRFFLLNLILGGGSCDGWESFFLVKLKSPFHPLKQGEKENISPLSDVPIPPSCTNLSYTFLFSGLWPFL